LLKRKSRPAPRGSRRRPARSSLLLEPLEDRCVPTILFKPQFGGETTTDNGGAKLVNPQVELIFWGSGWFSGTGPAASDLTNAADRIMKSSYFSDLSEYTPGFGQATLGVVAFDQSDPPAPFNDALVTGEIQKEISQQNVPAPGSTTTPPLYVVVTRPDSFFSDPNLGNVLSYHSSASFTPPQTNGHHLASYAWVDTFQVTPQNEVLTNQDAFTVHFGREVAEAITDANPIRGGLPGITATKGASFPGASSPGDIADFEAQNYYARLNGVNGDLVQSYWSNQLQGFIIFDQNLPTLVVQPNGTLLITDTNIGSFNTITFSTQGNEQIINIDGQVFDLLGLDDFNNILFSSTASNYQVNVEAIMAPLTIDLGSNDVVNISPSAKNLDNIKNVQIFGSSSDTLNVNDQNAALTNPLNTSLTYTITGGSIERGHGLSFFHPPPVVISYSGVGSVNLFGVNTQGSLNVTADYDILGTAGVNALQVDTGTATADVVVDATAANTSLAIIGHSSSGQVNVGNGQMQNILGTVSVSSPNAVENLTIDDHLSTASHTGSQAVTVTSTGVSGLGVTFASDQLSGLTLDGGSGTNTYNVLGLPAFGPTVLNIGTGADTVNVGGPANPLDTFPQDANSQVSLTVNGQGGNDTLNFNDQASTSFTYKYTTTATSMVRTIPAIPQARYSYDFSNITNLNVNGGSGSHFVVLGTPGPTTLTGGAGTDQFDVGSSTNTLDPIQGLLTLNGGPGTNTLNVNDQGAPLDSTRAFLITPTGFTRTPSNAPQTTVNVNGFQTEQFNESGSATVQGTAKGTSTTIDVFGSATAASLPVTLGPINPNNGQGTLQTIQGPLTILSGSSDPHTFPSVSMNDLADTSARTVSITSTQISGLTAPGAPINFPTASAETLGIEGPFVGGSTFNINGTPAIDDLQVVAPGTGDIVNVHAVPLAGAVGFPFTAAVVGQTVNVGQNHSLQTIQGTVEVANAVFKQFFPLQGIPLATVNVDDSGDTQQQAVTIGSGGITGPSGPITITTGSAVSVTYQGGVSSTGHNSYNITGTPANSTLTLSAPGPDTVNVQATAAGTTTAIQDGSGGGHTINVGNNPTNPPVSTLDGILGLLTVTSSSASDTLNILDKGSTTAHTYNLAQNPPTDTFTRTAPGTPTVTIQFSSIMHLNEQRGTMAGNPPMAADLAFPTTIAAGSFATMSGRLVGTGELSLSVDWGDGSKAEQRKTDLKPFSLKHKYDQPGTYHVRAVWTDSSGQSGFRELTIVVTAADGGDDN
jgi:hypothetical protein